MYVLNLFSKGNEYNLVSWLLSISFYYFSKTFMFDLKQDVFNYKYKINKLHNFKILLHFNYSSFYICNTVTD